MNLTIDYLSALPMMICDLLAKKLNDKTTFK